MIKNIIVKTIGALLVGSLVVGGVTNVVNAYSEIKNSAELEIVSQYKSPQIGSDVYELSNGASLVINDDHKIYKLFVEELGDWGLKFNTKEDLLKYERMYYYAKDNTKDYTNKNIEVKEGTFNGYTTYELTNTGIDIVLDGNKINVYFPMFEDMPYVTNANDIKNIIDTYLECTNDMKNDTEFSITDTYVNDSNTTIIEFSDGSSALLNVDKNLYEFFHSELGDWGLKVDNREELINVIKTLMEIKYDMNEEDIINSEVFKNINLIGHNN